MLQTVRKNRETIIVPIKYSDAGASGKVIAKLPADSRILSVNVTVDTAFNGTTPTVTLGVAGATTKFHNAFTIASAAGNTSAVQYTVGATTNEILMSLSATGATAGAGNVTIDYALPTKYSVEY